MTTLYEYMMKYAKEEVKDDHIINDPYNLYAGKPTGEPSSGWIATPDTLTFFTKRFGDEYTYWGVEDVEHFMNAVLVRDLPYYYRNAKNDAAFSNKQLVAVYKCIEDYLKAHETEEAQGAIASWPDNHIRFLKKLKELTTMGDSSNPNGRNGGYSIHYPNRSYLFYLSIGADALQTRSNQNLKHNVNDFDGSFYQKNADRLEKRVDALISAFEDERGLGDIIGADEFGDLASEDDFYAKILERTDFFVKSGLTYSKGWIDGKTSYKDPTGTTQEYPLTRREFVGGLIKSDASWMNVADRWFTFMDINFRMSNKTYSHELSTPNTTSGGGYILNVMYSDLSYGPAVHTVAKLKQKGNALVLKADVSDDNDYREYEDEPEEAEAIAYFQNKITDKVLKQSDGVAGRSYEGLQEFYANGVPQSEWDGGKGWSPIYSQSKINIEWRQQMSPNWGGINKGNAMPTDFGAHVGDTYYKQNAHGIFAVFNNARAFLMDPKKIAQSAWAEFKNDWETHIEGAKQNPKRNYFNEKFKGAYTAAWVREAYINVIAEVLAMQHLLYRYSLEVIDHWLSLPDIGDFDAIKKFDTGDIKAFIDKSKEYDTKVFDGVAGDLANMQELTDQEVRERQLFLKQCALLMNMQKLKKAYQGEFFKKSEPNSYNGDIYTLDVDDFDVRSQLVNRLISPAGQRISSFLDLSPPQQAALAPKLRFYRVYNDPQDRNALKQVEIVFPKSYNPDDSMYQLKNDDSGIFRGGAVGIKNFSWSFEGTTPATARNDIKASLTLYFQDFSELFRERSSNDLFGQSGEGERFKYIELLLLPGTTLKSKNKESENNNSRDHALNYDPANHRIRVDVGWEIRNDKLFREIMEDEKKRADKSADINVDMAEAINLINKSYYLNMVEHSMDFKDDGSVEVKIDYRAYLESAGKNINLDALTSISLAKQKKVLKEEYETIVREGICDQNRKRYEELISIYNAIELKIVKKSHQSIVERLVKNKRLHYCTIGNESVNNFAKNGFFISTPNLTMPNKISVAEEDVENAVEEKVKTNAEGKDEKRDVILDSELLNISKIDSPGNNQQVITFFYVGDLIHTVLDCTRDPDSPTFEKYPHLKNTKILLSSFDYRDPQNNLMHINLSEIPISTEYFFEWMNQNVIKPKRNSYPITYFIRDICNKLIVDLMLEVCVNRDAVKTLRFNSMNLLALGIDDGEGGNLDPFSQMSKIEDTTHVDVSEAFFDEKLPLASNLRNNTIDKMYNYLLFYPVTHTQGHTGEGDRYDDEEQGVYHFAVGKNAGVLKRMRFQKTDIQYIREARFYNHGHDGLMQLSAVYKVTLDMFGNTLFYPGMQIYIDPIHMGGVRQFDPTVPGSIANSLGFGGYHLITRVESSISSGKFNTTVEAQFVYSGDGSTATYNTTNKALESTEDLQKKANEQKQLSKATDDACTAITYLRERSFYDLSNLDINLAKINRKKLISQVQKMPAKGSTAETEE